MSIFPPVRSYDRLLEEAIAETRAAGFEADATKLEEACFKTPYTTSNELLHEHRMAMTRFLQATRRGLPAATRKKVRICLNEVELAVPGFRQLIAWLRRPRQL